MRLASKRFTGLIVVIISVLLALTASGFFYYVQINENESYQNQLHFRELNEVSRALTDGLNQLATVAKEDAVTVLINNYNQSIAEKVNRFIKPALEEFAAEHGKTQAELNKLAQAIADLEQERDNNARNQNTSSTATITLPDSEGLAQLATALTEKAAEIALQQQQLRERKYQHEDYIESLVSFIDNYDEQDIDYIGEQCDIDEEFCQWFDDLFAQYLEFKAYQNVDINELTARITSKHQAMMAKAELLTKSLKTEQANLTRISTLLKKSVTQLSQEPELASKLACDNALIWQSPRACESFTSSLASDHQVPRQQQSMPADMLKKQQTYGNNKNTASWQSDRNRLRQDIAYSQQINQLKQEALRYLVNQLKLTTTQAKVRENLTALKQHSITIAQAQAAHDQLAQARIKKAVANDQALSYLSEDISRKLTGFRVSIEEKQQALTQHKHDLLRQLEGYQKQLSFTDKAVFEESKDFKVFYENLKRVFNQMVDCINGAPSKALDVCAKNFTKLAELTKPQTLEKLLQSSTYLKNAQILTTNIDNFAQAKQLWPNQFNLFLSAEQQRQVAYFYKNQQKQQQQSLTAVPLVDLLGNNISRFPLLLLVDQQGKRLVRKDNSQLGSFQNGLGFDLTKQILKKLARQQNAEANFFQTSGQQVDSQQIIEKSIDSQGESSEQRESKLTRHGEILPGYSGFIDVSISGQDYRVFISPYQGKVFDLDNNQHLDTLYLMGFIAKSALVSKKLRISNTAVMISILCLIILMALIPLLKIRLIAVQQSFSLADRHWAFIGLGALAAMLAIAIFDYAFYQHLKHEVSQQSKAIHQAIRHNFKHEVSALTQYAYRNIAQLNNATVSNALFSDKSLSEQQQPYFLENLFILPESGKFNGSALWSSKQLYRKKEIDLNKRDYFKRAIRCDAWPMTFIDSSAQIKLQACQQQLYMQRIFNVRDSRKTTQLSIPLFEKTIASNKAILTFGTRVQSFFAPLLPSGFGFLVFDNATGEVLFHSDDERSLLENIYIETDNNTKLLKLVENANLTPEESSFTSSYRGKTHHFRAGRLAKNVPWTLAVFYDKSQLRTLNMLTVFTAISCFMLLVVTLYVLITLLTNKRFLQQLCWFNDKIQPRYQSFAIALILASLLQLSLYILLEKFAPQLPSLLVLAIMLSFSATVIFLLYQQIIATKPNSHHQDKSLNHYTNTGNRAYNGYVLALIIYAFATPAVLLSMASAGYYLEKYAVLQAMHLHKSQAQLTATHKNYYELVLDKDSVFHLNPNTLPCYLGAQATAATPTRAITCNSDEQDLLGTTFWFGNLVKANTQTVNNNVFDIVWHLIPLNFPFAQQTWLLSALEENDFEWRFHFSRKHNRILLNALWQNLASTVLSVVLAMACLYWLIRHWLSKRLIGTNVPANFRLNDSNKQSTAEKVKLLFKHLAITDPQHHHGRFVQIIRPTRQLFNYFSSEEKNPYHQQVNNLALTSDRAIAVSQLTDCNQNIEYIVKNILNVNNNSQAKTVIIKRLEMVALNAQQRIKALEILEYLVALGNVNIILLADITPLYRLTKQAAYPNTLATSDYANSDETVRWARLMKRFVKFYDWTPIARSACPSNASSAQVLAHEANSWPECQRLQQDFYDYHMATKNTEYSLRDGQLYDQQGNLVPVTQQDALLAQSINRYWSSEQIIEFFNANSGASYRYRWELCTKAERLLLIQLANGYAPNPSNIEPLEHLIRRGYIYQDNGWHLINQSFKRFVLSAESDTVVASWLQAAMESNWQYVRIPLFTLVLVAIAVLAYSASEAIESLMAILTGVLSLTPLLLRSFNLFKGNTSTENP
ncbi:hypothetical protein SAMN05216262_101623 [Colwellia chukchiensis]|uniref:Cache domain-containing protein n=1 Tax=Colwellia chukchiensis TaxID=641665 RepID=A0A1H7HXZ9_9GAMM|nr:hypothetical protein [Colwellia chukchiensis]SEK54472.1 hypothetical protein SAMN05216262_101623 [Colwellia chukchiensis]